MFGRLSCRMKQLFCSSRRPQVIEAGNREGRGGEKGGGRVSEK